MTKETYQKATELMKKIGLLEKYINTMKNNDNPPSLLIDAYQKELDDLNYKLYHLN